MRVADGARKINRHGGAIHIHIGGRQSLFPIARHLYPRASEPQASMAPKGSLSVDWLVTNSIDMAGFVAQI
jgi:hypothetical protein